MRDAQTQVEEMTRLSMKPQNTEIITKNTENTENTENIIVDENGNKIEIAKKNENLEKFKEIFDSKYNRQALVIGVGLVVFQQFSGQPSVLYFANRIFEKAGFGYEAALGVGVFKLVMTIISAGNINMMLFYFLTVSYLFSFYL